MDPTSLIESFGYFIIFLCIFLECGVLLGLVLPLPSFSLLFIAGVFANTDQLNLINVIIIGTLGAVTGYIAGYYTGKRYGRKLFYEKDTKKYFTKKQGIAAERFMQKYGYSTLVIGRWLPVLHSIAPILSGVAKTRFMPFMIANIAGGFAWVASSAYLGYYLGRVVPNAQYYVLPVVIVCTLLLNTPPGKRIISRLTKRIEEI